MEEEVPRSEDFVAASIDAATIHAATPFFEARALTKKYPGVVALNQVSFRVHPGEIVGLVGKNGAGKSTLIKALAGVVTPDEGSMFLRGEPFNEKTPGEVLQSGLAFVHQELSLVPDMTVAENVFLGVGFPKLGPFVRNAALRRATKAVLERFGTDVSPSAIVEKLSAVEQRLVMIAHALARNAEMLVLDEPSAALTVDEVSHLHSIVQRLAEDGVAIVYVSHRLPEILRLSHRVVVMRDGEVVAEGSTGDFDQEGLVNLICGAEVVSEERDRSARKRREASRHASTPEILLSVSGIRAPDKIEDGTLVVRKGEILGLAGLIGSGRTELARLIAGADSATGGTVALRGASLKLRSPRDAIRAGIVLLPEDRRREGNVLDASVRENVTLATLPLHRIVRGIPVPSRRSEARATLDAIQRLRIATRGPNTPVGSLSGGNQQKVLFAKWLQRAADIFILDEPTQGVDVEAKEEIFDLMEELAAAGKGVIFISSDFSELAAVCDRVVVMRERRTVAEFAATNGVISERSLVDSCYAVPPEER